MLKNHLHIALRNLRRNKAYTFINVAGLALSMACGILIFTMVKYHNGFDNFHADSDRIYRVVTEQHRDAVSYTNSVPTPLGKQFRQDYTYAEKVARVARFNNLLITIKNSGGGKKFMEEHSVGFVEGGYFDIFNFPFAMGNKQTALAEPNTVVITEQMAKKYFGNEDPLNKIITLENSIDFKVTGILKDLPVNTDNNTQVYLSYPTLKTFNSWLGSDDAWGGINSGMECFVKLLPNVPPYQVENALQTYVKKFRPRAKNVHHYKLQPLSDIHFNARYDGVMEKKNLWVLTCIALFLIVTACINFINLATAQAMNRSKEIGIRKVLGSLRGQLFWQFITETFFITLIAAIAAIGLSYLALPVVNNWFRSQMNLNPLSDPILLGFIGALIVVVTFFAGSYPGLILSGFKPIVALKNKITQTQVGGLNTRRSLIVTQFAISQVLIIGMIVIGLQMHYATNSDMGFAKDAIVMIPTVEENLTTMRTMTDRFRKIPGVEKTSLCYGAPASNSNWTTSMRIDDNTEEEVFKINVKSADNNYVSTFGLQLVAGRNIFPSDSATEYIVNETLARKLNLTNDQLIGKMLTINGRIKAPIVGVVKDFHDQSFHSDINPVAIASTPQSFNNYAVKINMADAKHTLASLEKIWSQANPDKVYQFEFLDEQIASFYQTEQLMLKLIESFALIAILIGCFGLYGLVSFIAAQKTKEIGIRKVLGGTIAHILWMFGKEFSRLILVAFVVAAPVAWWLMSAWLKDFKYPVKLSIWMFLVTILATAVITGITISYQSIKSSLANPVKSLRTD
ncbi:FtsX-like permease family protein [Sediminibacterium roseum]|uniref:FtsX-like permease family protein n=1 Tax=Sediminibacterium roseum TaxID=1978412 RepID=A0ABW9ZTV8_9BACT|nr:ABC transporter permease [Sediminibacterium roseum]NCI50576.1 FtsX-like permease family protein [Sediminibacterium roseum]